MTLALSRDRLRDSYEVVVVGSGYGGGIAACRLARAGRSVCVLERGREIPTGGFPDGLHGFLGEFQADLPGKRLGSPTALLDLRFNKDINVALGCGLGGTSLINAGIALRPDAGVFDDPAWPARLRGRGVDERHFARAERMLRPVRYPQDQPRLAKTAAIERVASAVGGRFDLAPLLVNFETLPDGRNRHGAEQGPCVGCGDCLSGCNYGAKNTVQLNYLADARRHGAEIFTELAVRSVESAQGGGWRIRYRPAAGGEPGELSAGVVILAAGTLGSTEILLRSRARGLRVSDALGHRFSGNGDMLGFSYNGPEPIRGVGMGRHRPPFDDEVPGPCSTAIVDLRQPSGGGMVLADGTLFGAVARTLPGAFAAGARLTGEPPPAGLGERLRARWRETTSKVRGARTGAMRNTMTFLVVATDDAGGVMHLEDDRLRIRWPGAGDQRPIEQAHQLIRRAAAALGGTYLPNPVWNRLTDQNLVTGHPLGGCPMADSAADGVVDDAGRVFRGDGGGAVHPGLYVMDGAIVPRGVGVNPLLTISGLAERAVELLLEEHGWSGAGPSDDG